MTANEKGRAAGDRATLRKQNNGKRNSITRGFRRDRLPEPADYYAAQGVRLTGRGAWRDALCPFHDDSKPSLRVRLETGAFRCMVCSAHGGDVLSFHIRWHGLGFVDAARALGAWEGAR